MSIIFSIIIPAYNEENSVQDILRRTLEARAKLKASDLGISEVEVLLVNDGSVDKTESLARAVTGVRVISHPRNRGYGAAIKTGFSQAQGELLGFLDADGTCDPNSFEPLIRLMFEKSLDIAVGSRMHARSKMPAVRIIGNWGFRTLVNLIGSSSVTDIASGMRVLRRTALERLYPLPDGLNFTPAMSVRGILDRRLRLGEIPMPYEDRVGRSKLGVVKDGLRFLGVILDTAITYRPIFFFSAAAALSVVLALWALLSSWGAPFAPLLFYWRHGHLEDWMIFRITFVTLCLSAAAFLAALGFIAQSLVAVINQEDRSKKFAPSFMLYGFLSMALALFLSRRMLISYLTTGTIPNGFWVFPLMGSLFGLIGVEFIAFALLGRIARLLWEREKLSRKD